MVDVSVVIVSWNARDYLVKCLRSLPSGLGALRGEILVVDNASNDGSPEAAESVDRAIQVIRTGENLGFAKGNNVGIRRATGRYVCLVDSDVLVHAGCIQTMVEYMDQHPGIGLMGPRILNGDGSLQASCRHFPTFRNTLIQSLGLFRIFPRLAKGWIQQPPVDRISSVEAVSGCFMLARREVLESVSLLDENFFMYAEDVDWCRRFRDKNFDVIYFPQATSTHFGGGSSASAPIRFYLEMQKANMQFFAKHYGRASIPVLALLMLLHHSLRLVGRTAQYALRPSSRAGCSYKIWRSLACLQWAAHMLFHPGDYAQAIPNTGWIARAQQASAPAKPLEQRADNGTTEAVPFEVPSCKN